jgi:hypothetical protein
MAKNKLSPEALEFFRKQGAKGGKIGGKKRVASLTPEQRSESARKASVARWGQAKSRDAPVKDAGDKLETPKKLVRSKTGK